MTPEAQRIAIAEACGITNIVDSEPWALWDEPPRIRPMGNIPSGRAVELPNYLDDLNAMHEAERVLTTDQAMRFRDRLAGNSGRLNTEYISVEAAMCHATAAQRAEAFLRTLGLWKE